MKKFKQLDELTQAKLIYSGELLLFSLVFIVIAILEFTKVIVISERHRTIYTWITIFGAALLIGDFIWFLKSPKHRKSSCLIDKLLSLPIAIFLIIFDSISFANNIAMSQEYYQYGIPSVLIYAGCLFLFESIYHYYKPLEMLIDEIKKAEETPEPNENNENKEN